MERIIDLTAINSEEQLYRAVELAAGGSFAHNLDALYDVLTELSHVQIRANKAVLQTALGTKAQAVVRVLKDAQRENDGLVMDDL